MTGESPSARALKNAGNKPHDHALGILDYISEDLEAELEYLNEYEH
jgi:hypothetical protein